MCTSYSIQIKIHTWTDRFQCLISSALCFYTQMTDGSQNEIPKKWKKIIFCFLVLKPNLSSSIKIFLLIFFSLWLNKNQPDFDVTQFQKCRLFDVHQKKLDKTSWYWWYYTVSCCIDHQNKLSYHETTYSRLRTCPDIN